MFSVERPDDVIFRWWCRAGWLLLQAPAHSKVVNDYSNFGEFFQRPDTKLISIQEVVDRSDQMHSSRWCKFLAVPLQGTVELLPRHACTR